MINFLKRNKTIEKAAEPAKSGIFSRLTQGLKKTRGTLASGLSNLLLGKKEIDAGTLNEIETLLLTADVGVAVAEQIIGELTAQIARKQLNDPQAVSEALQTHLCKLLKVAEQPLQINSTTAKPYVILVVGVNGVGKTTTIGKLARRLQQEGKKVLLAAGDTFRAAAVEQLKVWGEREQIPVISQQPGADSAAVIFDALQSAQARNFDVLIADTAGRLHTKDNLMSELQKVKKVLTKLDPKAPHEVLLVLDAGNGQNALNQAEQFHNAVNLTGIVLTKLDGTAKGGIIFAIAKKLGLPIRFISIGEGVDDLRPFEAAEFVSALFAEVSE